MNDEPMQEVDECSSYEDRIAELESFRRYNTERITRILAKIGSLDRMFDSLDSCHRALGDTRHFTEDRLDALEAIIKEQK
jgi:hypothetical protein